MLARINIREILEGTKVLISRAYRFTPITKTGFLTAWFIWIVLNFCVVIFKQECHYHIFSLSFLIIFSHFENILMLLSYFQNWSNYIMYQSFRRKSWYINSFWVIFCSCTIYPNQLNHTMCNFFSKIKCPLFKFSLYIHLFYSNGGLVTSSGNMSYDITWITGPNFKKNHTNFKCSR